MAKRFVIPFAEAGDRALMPDAPVGTDSNYQTGYTSQYEEDPVVNPLTAKFVERDKSNQLYNDITANVKEWQEHAYPAFITSAVNGGVPFAYKKNSIVTYLGVDYISIFDGNEDVPPSSKWVTHSALINDLSQGYTFPTVAAYKNFTTAFPVGKNIHLQDRKANFLIIAGTGTATERGIIANTNTTQSASIISQSRMTPKMFGALGDGNVSFATENAAAIQEADAFTEYLYFDDGTDEVTYNVTGLARRANTTWDKGNAVILRTQNLDLNLIEAIGTSYDDLLENVITIGGTVRDTSASVSSGVIFAFCGNVQINGTKFEGLAKNNTPAATDLDGHQIAGLAIASCVGGNISGVGLSGFRDDGLILAGGDIASNLQLKAVNAIKVSRFSAIDMAVSGIGSNRGANGCVITNFTIERCGDGFAWASINSADNIISNGVIIGDEDVVYSGTTYGLRVGHGSSGAGFSTSPRCQANNITIKNVGSGAQFAVTDGGSAKNIRVFNVVQDGVFITDQKDFTCDVYVDGAGRDGVRVSNSEDVKIKCDIIDVQENGVTVIEATQVEPSLPLGITNLDISGKFKDYSQAGIDIARGAIFISQGLEVGSNIKVHDCEFKASQAYNCIVHRHTKEIVSYYDNVVTGDFGSFILAANQARQNSAAVRGNRKLTSGTEVALYPEHVIETGRGSGATTSITSTKYGNWSELLTDNTDFSMNTSALIDAGTTNTSGNALSFAASLAASTVTYTYTGGGTLSFSMEVDKTISVTP